MIMNENAWLFGRQNNVKIMTEIVGRRYRTRVGTPDTRPDTAGEQCRAVWRGPYCNL